MDTAPLAGLAAAAFGMRSTMSAGDLVALLSLAAFAVMLVGFVRLCLAAERALLWRSLGLLAAYFAYVGGGVAAVWWLAEPPAPPHRALAAALLALAWIGYGGVWLWRWAPRGDARTVGAPPGPVIDAGFALAALVAGTCLIAG